MLRVNQVLLSAYLMMVSWASADDSPQTLGQLDFRDVKGYMKRLQKSDSRFAVALRQQIAAGPRCESSTSGHAPNCPFDGRRYAAPLQAFARS